MVVRTEARATFGRMNVHDNILGAIGNTPMAESCSRRVAIAH